MGSVCGKKEENLDEDETEGLFDPTKTFWDEDGNLRYGKKRITAKAKEKVMREIMALDELDDVPDVKEEEKGGKSKKNWKLMVKEKEKNIVSKAIKEDGNEKDRDEDLDVPPKEDPTWYIMDSVWLASWLAHVYYDKESGPAPGPCHNKRLIEWDQEGQCWKGRFGLRMAVSNHAGDYRRVTEECWKKYQSLYPGSGPSITMKYKQAASLNGFYDTSNWTIIDPPAAPPVSSFKTRKKAKRASQPGPSTPDEDGTIPADSTPRLRRTPSMTGYIRTSFRSILTKGDCVQLINDGSEDSSLFTKTKNAPKLSFAQDIDSDDDPLDGGTEPLPPPSDQLIEDVYFDGK
jgi:hypothetical protein